MSVLVKGMDLAFLYGRHPGEGRDPASFTVHADTKRDPGLRRDDALKKQEFTP